jgi:hypothetical protein
MCASCTEALSSPLLPDDSSRIAPSPPPCMAWTPRAVDFCCYSGFVVEEGCIQKSRSKKTATATTSPANAPVLYWTIRAPLAHSASGIAPGGGSIYRIGGPSLGGQFANVLFAEGSHDRTFTNQAPQILPGSASRSRLTLTILLNVQMQRPSGRPSITPASGEYCFVIRLGQDKINDVAAPARIAGNKARRNFGPDKFNRIGLSFMPRTNRT